MRQLFLLTVSFLLLSVSNNLWGQMEINEKSTRKENRKDDTTSWETEIFAISNWSNTYRFLKPNDGLFGKELGERANEYAINTWSFGIGFRSRINDFLAWDGGLSWLRNGEGYRYEENDSIFQYSNTYSYIAMPVKLNFRYGRNYGVLVAGGLIPQMFMNVNREENWRTVDNTTGGSDQKIRSGYNSFVLSAVFNAGGFVRFNNRWVLGFYPEYRFQLTNSYLKTDDYKHFGKALGFNISLGMQL